MAAVYFVGIPKFFNYRTMYGICNKMVTFKYLLRNSLKHKYVSELDLTNPESITYKLMFKN